MSAFKALNVESDDESDVEIDDTKEIQIEEALKLYQSALKYHSDGPESYGKAAQAYEELFDSEIFKYPESQTELQRIELYGLALEDDELGDDPFPVIGGVTANFETGPNTLPQILYLSHKNYAQFKLDALSAKFNILNVTWNQVLIEAVAALNHFVQALDKDESDLDLWRRTASVGELLESKRVARFCLEAVLDGDDVGLTSVMSLPGLEESLAGDQLRDLIAQLQDQLALLQAPLSITKRKTLSKVLKQQLYPYDGILQYKSAIREHGDHPPKSELPDRIVLKAPTNWAELGDTLLRQLMAEQHGTSFASPGLAIAFDLDEAQVQPLKAIEAPSAPASAFLVDLTPYMVLPATMDEQFPGLDNGQPTAQPQIASADPSMQVTLKSPAGDDVSTVAPATMTLPSRKRSGDAAGLNDGAEEVRTKSRRTRARESNVDTGDGRQAIIDANTRWEYEQQLNEFQAADDWMFETVGGLFERIGIVRFDAARNVRQEMAASTDITPPTDPDLAMRKLKNARGDIQVFLDKFTEQEAHVLLHGGEKLDLGDVSGTLGAGGMFSSGSSSRNNTKTPLIPEDGLFHLLESLNEGYTLTQDAAWKFIETLLRPGILAPHANSYVRFLWPEALKTMVVRTLVNFDDNIYDRSLQSLNSWKHSLSDSVNDHGMHEDLADLVEAVFELHLDIYSLIKQPNSGVEADIVTAQGDRLQRWSELARECMHCRTVTEGSANLQDPLNIRFLWATTFHLSVSSDVSQDHVIECLNDLRDVLSQAGEPIINLQNNAIMPELSLSTLDRETSKLTTKDFFLRVTNQDFQDPASVIESLEPLLEALDIANGRSEVIDKDLVVEPASSLAPELVKFLESSDVSVYLLLWQRLRDAYVSIDYNPMVVCCYLRMIRLVLDELKCPEVTNRHPAERKSQTLKCLRLLQDMTKRLFDILQSSKDALDCLDHAALKAAVNSFGEILQLLQVFNVAEDSIRVGQSSPPLLPNGLAAPSFNAITKVIHEMQIHIWIVLYALLKEAVAQHGDLYPTPLEDQFDFLRTVHRSLGIRGICGGLNRVFIRMLKDEFSHMTHVDGCDSEQAQVLYDLHRLNCFLNPSYELIEHKCTSDAFLDRKDALQAVDLLLAQASKLTVNQLVKHSLKDAIDKVHGAVPRKKPTDAILRNREVYRAFLRSPIIPLDLFNCIKGEGNQLPTIPIPKADALLASKGWYFLMGQMCLTKFRSQKRTSPMPTEDVDIAIAFFMQDLEYTQVNWETWFRLAQAFDTKIEENVVWSAERLNNEMSTVISLQRQALHCYTMATAMAQRSADLTFEASEKMTELYYDFAIRLYSSARKPFDMQAFKVDDIDRFVSVSTGVMQQKATTPLRVYTAHKLSLVLLQRALPGKPDNWMIHHMIGKCLWKMHSAPENLRPHEKPPQAHRVLQACVRALELLPDRDRKESRDSKKEPVLEPHYKLVSVVHKLLTETKTINLQEAKAALNNTTYANKEPLPQSLEDWIPFVLAVLKHLRAADKSNWYHRMIYRSAKITYDRTSPSEYTANGEQDSNAIVAKQELTQQMFTKTMVLQVWRPEGERPGRHFVYTALYTRFFVQILKQLKDRQGLEQLARRVRRRPQEIFEHALVWQDICIAYLLLLRNHAALADGLETSIFSNMAHEEFLAMKQPLEKWMQAQETGVSPALDVLREVQELKKINQSLMKTGAIDDLIGDSYAHVFSTVGKQVWDEERRANQEEEARKDAQRLPPALSPPRNPMMSLTHLMNVDVSSDEKTRADPLKTETLVSQSTDALPARRKIGVGRREIRTCAEACFQKTRPQHSEEAIQRAIANSSHAQVLIKRKGLNLPSLESSAPGSIHDSADDESELSELEDGDDDGDDEEEDEEEASTRRPLFPNLATVSGGVQGQAQYQGSDAGRDMPEQEEQDDVEMAGGEDDPGVPAAIDEGGNGETTRKLHEETGLD